MSTPPKEGEFEIVSLNVSEKTGVRKTPVASFRLEAGKGISGDAHAGLIEERQVSLLAVEEIEGASVAIREGCAAVGDRGRGARSADATASSPAGAAACVELKPGDFAENITTRGLALHELPIGTRIRLGGALVEVSKIGKECHAACEIRRLVGDCVMPRKGIFARVIEGGEVSREDRGHYRIG